MIVLLDASTVINLVNGGVFDAVLSIEGVEYQVGSLVRDEVSSAAEVLDLELAKGSLTLADDGLVSYSEFLVAKNDMGLGDGETECILIASAIRSQIACDDGRARKAAIKRLGHESLVTGSLGLMQRACSQGLISPEVAYLAYEEMRKLGGYLPQIDINFFAVEAIP
ncbi:hypothetical protein [Xanthomonas bonasiae]|uniref:hypothetical protein n=1 Tax=Xanthomonas bonasiae TaxID=2810351 RepID=UPI00198181C1|nr:hypothetical protein [Xanthomonas bonasiae]MBN6111408.1 hypothetical protein [Xanthomonas bonasiae]